MKRFVITAAIAVLAAVMFLPERVLAQHCPDPQQCPDPMGPPHMYRGMPYGHFNAGFGRGPYGKRMPVLTADQAKLMTVAYFTGLGETVTIGKVEEGRLFFELEILNKDGILIDKTIVDKRTGRMRSIY